MIGFEINNLVADKLRINLSRFKNVEIKSNNIFDCFPIQANIFYLFNPFKKEMMQDFREQIWKIKENNPIILYYNPTCLEVFEGERFKIELKNMPEKHFGVDYKLAIIRMA